jgi:hypothetical protein
MGQAEGGPIDLMGALRFAHPMNRTGAPAADTSGNTTNDH